MNTEKIKDEAHNTNSYFSYRVIKKKSGGHRLLHVLHKGRKPHFVKLKRNIDLLPVHKNAVAYIKKQSIPATMDKHRNDTYFFKFDFSNFFGSFTLHNVLRFQNGMFNEEELGQLILPVMKIGNRGYGILRTNKLAVPQGSPLSPQITNYWMYGFDEKMTIWAEKNKMHYSRYADDILISGENNFPQKYVSDIVKENLKRSGRSFIKLNEKKTAKLKRGGKIRFLGTSVAADGKLTIGHKERKALIGKLRMYKKHGVGNRHDANGFTNTINQVIYLNSVNTNKIDIWPFIKGTSLSRCSAINRLSEYIYECSYAKLKPTERLNLLNSKKVRREMKQW